MRIEVLPYPGNQPNREQSDKTFVVLDILRATSTIVTALANGATEVIPVADPSEAIQLAKNLGEDQCLTGGERGGLPIPGLNLGNSPLEYTREVVGGKKAALCTTNGTVAIRWSQSGKRVLIGSFLNLPAVVEALRQEDDVLLVCSGRNGSLALEDFVCAGMIVHRLVTLFGKKKKLSLSDSAVLSRLAYQNMEKTKGLPEGLAETAHGKDLTELGLGEDILYCAQVGLYDVVPVYESGRVRV